MVIILEVIIEIKLVKMNAPVHPKLLTYLRLTNLKLGFLINFNVPLLKEGFNRYVNNFQDEILTAMTQRNIT